MQICNLIWFSRTKFKDRRSLELELLFTGCQSLVAPIACIHSSMSTYPLFDKKIQMSPIRTRRFHLLSVSLIFFLCLCFPFSFAVYSHYLGTVFFRSLHLLHPIIPTRWRRSVILLKIQIARKVAWYYLFAGANQVAHKCKAFTLKKKRWLSHIQPEVLYLTDPEPIMCAFPSEACTVKSTLLLHSAWTVAEMQCFIVWMKWWMNWSKIAHSDTGSSAILVCLDKQFTLAVFLCDGTNIRRSFSIICISRREEIVCNEVVGESDQILIDKERQSSLSRTR